MSKKKTVHGLEELKKVREKTINKWKKSGLLEGLTSGVDENIAKLFESPEKYIINEDPKQIVDD
jgi:hypothetical protein